MTLRKATEAKAEKRYQALSEFMTDLPQANQAHLNAVKNTPWLERNPLLFWKILCGLLLAVNV